jgi:hypothetical protein
VQRPGVAEAIALDTYILRYMAGAFVWFLFYQQQERDSNRQPRERPHPNHHQPTNHQPPKTPQHKTTTGALRAARKLNTNLPLLVDEWASSLFRELDYRRCVCDLVGAGRVAGGGQGF